MDAGHRALPAQPRASPVERDVLGLEELHEPLVRPFAADSALLHSAERRGWIGNEAAVEPDHTEFEPLGYPHAATNIARVEIRHKAIFRIVRFRHRLVLGLECLQ